MEETIRHLRALGLSEKEARVYSALVSLGKASAYAIAKEAELKRPTTYLILDELRKKDLVGKVPHTKRHVYVAKDPEELLEAYELKLRKARRALPSLLKNQQRHSFDTRLFEGRDELVKALEYKRETLANTELRAFFGLPHKSRKIPEAYYNHAASLKRQGTAVRALATDDPSLKHFRSKDAEYNQNVLYLPKEEYAPNVSVEIGEDLVKIYLHLAAQVLVVENREFASLLKEVFEIVWKNKNSQ